MNLIDIINNLFTNPTSAWILDVDDADINPVIIQRFLILHKTSLQASRILNKFVYTIEPKMYLSSVWSLLFVDGKKLSKAPFIKYPKKIDTHERYGFLFDKIQKHFKIKNRVVDLYKPILTHYIEKDKATWFSFYGIAKEIWRDHYIDYHMLKDYGDRKPPTIKKGLAEFF